MVRYSLSDGTWNFPDRTSNPAAPTPGRVKLFIKGLKPYIIESGGTVKTFESVFGSGASDTESNSSLTNTSTTYQAHSTLVLSNLVEGARMRIGSRASWGMSVATRNINIALNVDGAEKRMLAVETGDTGADIRNSLNEFTYFTVTALQAANGAVVKIEYRPEQSGDTATIYSSAIECWRVS
ncbi:MAG: hypothetical protein IMF01_09390 [Proteobacteria bacterium]|nr:hypothetical protein [Pseudomonadota bacterium]